MPVAGSSGVLAETFHRKLDIRAMVELWHVYGLWLLFLPEMISWGAKAKLP